MRSYTTVLAHILGSSAEVSGYFETHQDYHNRLDLLWLRLHVAEGMNYRLKGRFLLDKMLHNYSISPKILGRDDVFVIFIIREPEPALRSLMTRRHLITSEAQALNYYTSRLKQLAGMRPMVLNRLYLDAESILGESGSSLTALANFLDLREPLSSTYSRFKYTGLPRYGDDSNLIALGKIVRENRLGHDDFALSKEVIEKANEVYQTVRHIFAGN